MKKTLKLLWMDENIDNQQNRAYQQKLQELQIDINFFNIYLDAQQFIQKNEQIFDLVMIISEALLYKLDPSLKGYFICFCGNSKLHYQKFLDLKQLIALIDNEFDKLKLLLKQYIQFLKSKQTLHLSFCPSFVQQTNYQHSIEELSFRFLMMIAKLKQNVNITEQKKLEEMLDSDLRKMVNENQLNEIKQKIKSKNFSILEKLMYYYSSNLIYQKLNQHFASQNYEEIQNIILVLFDGFSKLKYTQTVPKFVYRGISFDEQTYQNNINDLLNSEKNQKYIFWNALTSVSRNKAVAQYFASHKNYGIIFEIELSQENPHPYFYFNDSNSEYYEQEILLFPQFGFQVKKNNSDGKFLFCQIKQIQNNFALALNQDKREQYWNERIEKEIKQNLEQVLKFNITRIYSVINILCNSNEIKNKSEVLKEEVIFCFKNLIEQFKEYYPEYSQFHSLLDSFISVIQNRMNFNFSIDQTSVQPIYELINAVIQNFQDEFIKLIKRLLNFQPDNLIRNIKGYSIQDGLQKQGSYNSKHIYKEWEPKQEFNKSGQSRILLIGNGDQTYLFNKICNAKLSENFNQIKFNTVGQSIINNIEVIYANSDSFINLEGWLGLQKALGLGLFNQIFVVDQITYRSSLYLISAIIAKFKQYINLITFIVYNQYHESDDDFQEHFKNIEITISKKYNKLKCIAISRKDSPQDSIQKILNVYPINIQYEVRLSENLIIEESLRLKKHEDDEFFVFIEMLTADLIECKIHPILSSVQRLLYNLEKKNEEHINNIVFCLRIYVFNWISTTIVEYMNKNEKSIEEQLSKFTCKDDKYLTLWNVLYEINQVTQQEYENINQIILDCQLSNSTIYRNLKACPHCGLIWLKVSDCNGLSNCGEFPQTEANYVEKFFHQIYTFTIENEQISFKKSEEQLQGKYYQQPQEKLYTEPQKRVGCGKYFDWDILPTLDKKIINEQLFSFNLGQQQDELEQKIWSNPQNNQQIQKSKQKFQNEILNLIINARVDYL
ncbi:unnamed protein product [Paramecium sonneborni]|uniref:Uncharacterized protein n=1 Tax=Paramecium sonneborni TaxID=65129 RepID=A0A8S1N4D1_9CILI|nr:unnamed protein product [Paramecium sonneborni]